MPTLPPLHRARNRERTPELRARGSARQRGYDARWDAAAALHLKAWPLCAYCALTGGFVAATLVDHLYPHRGNRDVFWRREWWVSSCRDCHSGMKQSLERKPRSAIDALAVRLGLPTWGDVFGHAPPGGAKL